MTDNHIYILKNSEARLNAWERWGRKAGAAGKEIPKYVSDATAEGRRFLEGYDQGQKEGN